MNLCQPLMRTSAFLLAALVLPASALAQPGAQDEMSQTVAEAGGDDANAASAQREAMRAELAAAQKELNTAARRLAQAQRRLVETEQDRSRVHIHEHNGHERIKIIIDDAAQSPHDDTPLLGVLVSGRPDDNTVLGLTPGGGAEAAGLQRGDRVLAINGRTLDEATSITDALRGVEPGQSVPVRVARGDETLTFQVEPSAPGRDIRFFTRRFGPDRDIDIDIDVNAIEEELAGAEREIIRMHERLEEPGPMAGMPRLPGLFALGQGADLVANHAGLAPYFGTGEGVLVLRIAEQNGLGLVAGDVILAIDGDPVSRPVELARAMLDREAGASVTIAVMRQGQREQLNGEVPASPLSGLRRGAASGY